ncbi:hypothetical protein [Sorangium cellulosum]|uniref:hypothetical protein n=1 Tax=Sorangium cellulosum TaxID=56 RepID=UPI0003FF4124|nr:hypothetical protein [Sorangium cellulosum]
MNLRPGARALALLLLSSAACGGPPTPSPVEGEPICPDFEVGATRAPMRGSLRFPVALTVRDGKDPITRATLTGRRSKDDPVSRILLADEDAEYELEWAQCENERAPRARTLSRESKDAAEYACGNATVYKTDKLVTRKGDAASRTVHFAAPPKPECWESELPAAAPAPSPAAVPEPAPADASAEPASADGGAADAGAGATSADAGAPRGSGATPADAGAPRGVGAVPRDGGAGGAPKPPSAGAGDAGAPPQGS